MASRKKRARAAPVTYEPVPDLDYGPGMRLEVDGRYKPWRGAARVDVASRPDGDHPTATVRGARRRNILDDLASRRTISRRQHNAANRLLDDCSLAAGSGMRGDTQGIRSSVAPSGLPETQVAALARVRAAWALLKLREDPGVFGWVVFDNRTTAAYESSRKIGHGKGLDQLKESLDLLASHYEYIGDLYPRSML